MIVPCCYMPIFILQVVLFDTVGIMNSCLLLLLFSNVVLLQLYGNCGSLLFNKYSPKWR